MLNELSQEELCALNNENSELLTKDMLIAKCIEKTIEKFYNFIREIPHSRRKLVKTRETQILYEKIYWRDIACGVPESEAKESLHLIYS